MAATEIESISLSSGQGDKAITITYGEVAENHIGQQKVGGDNADKVIRGLSTERLESIRDHFISLGATAELIDLCEFAAGTEIEHSPDLKQASVLIIREGVSVILKKSRRDFPELFWLKPKNNLKDMEKTADHMFEELTSLEWDSKFFSRKHYDPANGKDGVVNKRARHNLCFDDHSQTAEYEKGKGTIISFRDVPCTSLIREKVTELISNEKETDVSGGILKAEGNLYPMKGGIGFHGDTERKIVVACRLGREIPLHYQWFFKGCPVGKRCELLLHHGDIYFMSEKAVGSDWKRRVIPTLRHAAGSSQYTTIRSKASPKMTVPTDTGTVDMKVKNPETNRMISVGKGVYNALLKKGYTLVNGELVWSS